MLDRAFEYIPRKPEETVLYRMIEQRGLEHEADTLSNLYSRMAGAREYSAPASFSAIVIATRELDELCLHVLVLRARLLLNSMHKTLVRCRVPPTRRATARKA